MQTQISRVEGKDTDHYIIITAQKNWPQLEDVVKTMRTCEASDSGQDGSLQNNNYLNAYASGKPGEIGKKLKVYF